MCFLYCFNIYIYIYIYIYITLINVTAGQAKVVTGNLESLVNNKPLTEKVYIYIYIYIYDNNNVINSVQYDMNYIYIIHIILHRINNSIYLYIYIYI